MWEPKWPQDAKGKVEKPEWVERVVLAAALAMFPVLVVQDDAKSQQWRTAAQVANWVIWAIFALELAAILYSAQRKGAALRRHWPEVALVVVTVPLYGRLFSSFRLLRLLRPAFVVTRALQAERRLTAKNVFRFAALATVYLVFIAGAAEATVDHGDFKTSWDGIWWAVVTVTTVGYGDLYPHSVAGRLVAMLLMFVGIGFIAVLTASIASTFVKSERREETETIEQMLAKIQEDLAEVRRHMELEPSG